MQKEKLTAVRATHTAVGAEAADELADLVVAALPAGFLAEVAGPGAGVPRQLESLLQQLPVPTSTYKDDGCLRRVK